MGDFLMKKLIIDRFEGTYAVCENSDKSFITIPKYKLPPDCKEGDYITMDSNGIYKKDNLATNKQKIHIRDRMNHLFEQ